MMPRRKPIGCTFCPMAQSSCAASRSSTTTVMWLVRLRIARRAALRARQEALRRSGPRRRTPSSRRACRRRRCAASCSAFATARLERLRDDLRAALRRELAGCRAPPRRRLPRIEVDDQARLLRRDAHVAGAGSRFHALAFGAPPAAGAAREPSTLALRSPEWPRNVRVGANSPSLWPTMFSVT